MPLSRARMNERKRQDRADVKPKSNLNSGGDVKPSGAIPVKPNVPEISQNPKLEALRNLIKGIERGDVVKPADAVIPNIPIYNPAIHKAGDKVLVKRGSRFIEAVIPKLDAEGRVIPDYD